MASQLISPARFRRLMRQSLLLPVLALAIVAALLVTQIMLLVNASQAEDRSDRATAQANLVLRLAIDAETGERGYLVGKNPIFLAPYTQAIGKIGPAFTALEGLVPRNSEQSARVREMRLSYGRWLDEAHTEVALLQQGGSGYRAYFNLHKGKDLMDALRGEFDQFTAAEQALHGQRQAAAQRALRLTVGLTVLSALAVSALLASFSRRQVHTLVTEYDHALTSEVESREMLSATLLGIGDAVLVTDERGRVTLLNPVAERLTGWTTAEAVGQNSQIVFHIINETTRQEVDSPIRRVIDSGVVVGLANHTLLVRRDGTEIAIDDSGAPIRSPGGELVGVVLVFRDVSERRAAERELQRSLRREHTIAATLQRSLLQSPPASAFPGVLLGSVYEPARMEADGDTMEVGGDFLDAFALSDHHVALVVGDVSGKGLVAAARTAEVLYTLRGILRECGQADAALTRLNGILCRSHAGDADVDGFICISVALLDTARQTVTFCLAGAEPPLIVRADGRVEEVALHGVPLAVTPDAHYGVIEVGLQPGDTFTLTTDGITEARRGPEFLGPDGLARLAADLVRNASPQEVAERILAGAKEFAGGPLRDDACVLVARCE